MSLAALLGLDARVLLATDDPATHAVYDRVIKQTAEWWPVQADSLAQRIAVKVVTVLGEAIGRG